MKLTEIIRNLVTNFNSHAQSTENPHGVTAAQVGLEHVDNTADADKPVSNAVAAALLGLGAAEPPAWVATEIAPGTSGYVSDDLSADNQEEALLSGDGTLPLYEVGGRVHVSGFSNPANNGVFRITRSTNEEVGLAGALIDEPAGAEVTIRQLPWIRWTLQGPDSTPVERQLVLRLRATSTIAGDLAPLPNVVLHSPFSGADGTDGELVAASPPNGVINVWVEPPAGPAELVLRNGPTPVGSIPADHSGTILVYI